MNQPPPPPAVVPGAPQQPGGTGQAVAVQNPSAGNPQQPQQAQQPAQQQGAAGRVPQPGPTMYVAKYAAAPDLLNWTYHPLYQPYLAGMPSQSCLLGHR